MQFRYRKFTKSNGKNRKNSFNFNEKIGNRMRVQYFLFNCEIKKFSKLVLSGNCSIYVETNNWLFIPAIAYSTIFFPFLVQSNIPIGGLSPSCISFSL